MTELLEKIYNFYNIKKIIRESSLYDEKLLEFMGLGMGETNANKLYKIYANDYTNILTPFIFKIYKDIKMTNMTDDPHFNTITQLVNYEDQIEKDPLDPNSKMSLIPLRAGNFNCTIIDSLKDGILLCLLLKKMNILENQIKIQLENIKNMFVKHDNNQKIIFAFRTIFKIVEKRGSVPDVYAIDLDAGTSRNLLIPMVQWFIALYDAIVIEKKYKVIPLEQNPNGWKYEVVPLKQDPNKPKFTEPEFTGPNLLNHFREKYGLLK